MPLLERWVLAGARLGPLGPAYARTGVAADVANILRTTGSRELAGSVQERGPYALSRLDAETRSHLAGFVDRSLSPDLRVRMQTDSVRLEKLIGIATPVRLVVFGRAGDEVPVVLDAEFGKRRGSAVILEKPSPSALSSLSLSRHQFFSPAPASAQEGNPPSPPSEKISRFPNRREDSWDFVRLSRLGLPGSLFTRFAAQSFVPMEAGDWLRLGGLVLMAASSGMSPRPPIADIVFVSGGMIPQGERIPIALGDANETYGVVDFDPKGMTFDVSVHQTSTRRPMFRTTIPLRKDLRISHFLEENAKDEVTDLVTDQMTSDRLTSLLEARRAVNFAFPFAVAYLEWLEKNPESVAPERNQVLGALQQEMMGRIPQKFEDQKDSIWRDLFKAFEGFLRAWGLSDG